MFNKLLFELTKSDVAQRKKQILAAIKITVLALAVSFLLLVAALVIDLVGMNIKYTLEAGEPLPSSDELSGRSGTEYDFGNYDGEFDKVGEYRFHVVDGSRKLVVRLTVVDTKAPAGAPSPLKINITGPYPEAKDFFGEIIEPSDYTARFINNIDVTTLGTKDVRIRLADEHGNTVEHSTTVTVIEDKEAPMIIAPTTIAGYLGEAVAYTKGVTVTDNCFGEVRLSVDTSSVNTDRVGSYIVKYTATDAAGNVATLSVTLNVFEERITKETLMSKISTLAAKLGIGEELSKEEKCRMIYGYVNSPTLSASDANIVFTDESNTDRSDWIREAYLTLERGSGDCYSYFAVSKAFFEYFGIENRDIERSAGVTTQSGTHFWCMVNIGSGNAPEWYYFDATRLAVKHKTGSGCLFTEAQLTHYNTKVKVGFLTYDHAGYPTASEKTINEGYKW